MKILNLILAGIILSSSLITSCSKDSDDPGNELEPTEFDYKDYYGKWKMTRINNAQPTFTRESNTLNNQNINRTLEDGPNLKFHTPDGWVSPVMVNDNSNEMEIGDPLYLKWCILNNGNQDFFGYVDYEVYIDDVFFATLSSAFGTENLSPNQYVTDFWGSALSHPSSPYLTEGPHTIRIIIVCENITGNAELSLQDNEYNLQFNVSSPEIKYEYFEFSKNRYHVVDITGQSYYGKIQQSGSSYTLENSPISISDIQVDGDNISFDLVENKSVTSINYTGVLNNRVKSTDLTLKLMDGPWKLDFSTHSNPKIDQLWNFLPGGTYSFENKSGTVDIFSWSYRDESSINYNAGGIGFATIIDISSSYLKITDENYEYEFSK